MKARRNILRLLSEIKRSSLIIILQFNSFIIDEMQGNTVIRPTDMGITKPTVNKMRIKPISWADFRGNVPENQWYLAHIYWHIQYSYGYSTPQNKFPKVTVSPTVSAKSWKKEYSVNDSDLLRHEYGHYLIGCLCALDFQSQVNSVDGKRFSSVDEFRIWADKLFKTLMKQYCSMERLYDKETEHYCNEEQQAKWEQKIANMINKYAINEEPQKKKSAEQKVRKASSQRKVNQNKNSNWRIRQTCKKPSIPKSNARIALKL